jgi:hypothetical protein
MPHHPSISSRFDTYAPIYIKLRDHDILFALELNYNLASEVQYLQRVSSGRARLIKRNAEEGIHWNEGTTHSLL